MPSVGEFTSQIAGAGGGLIKVILLLMIGILIVTPLVIGFMYLLNYIKYNMNCWVYSQTNSGLIIKKLKGGLIKKRGNLEFRTWKPKYRIDNFDNNKILMQEKKTLFGIKWIKNIYFWQRKDNLIEQINTPEFYEDKNRRISMLYFPRELGVSDFKDDFESHIQRLWDWNDILGKYGNVLGFSGIVFVLILIVIFLLQKMA